MRYTDAPLRRQELLRRLTAAGHVSSDRVAVDLGVSAMTIRRDLRRLDADGLVHRVAGGAVLLATSGEPFEQRVAHGTQEKETIARAAVATTAAPSMALDAGTTVAHVVPHLAPGTLVVTHSVPVMGACAERGDLELIGLGGAYQPSTRSFAGPATRAGLQVLAVEAALLSAVAVRPDGLYCANPLDAETKQLLVAAAGRVVVLVDHTKLTASAPLRFATLDAVDVLVVDSGVDPEHLAMLRGAVAEVVVA